jgi:ribosomal protein S18 acetylase RimI-like enzyme
VSARGREEDAMVEGGKELSERDLKRLAELHVASIEDSIPTLVGVPFAVEFYRFIAESPHEWLLVERVGEEIAIACVVSDDPASVYARTVRRTWWTLLRCSLLAFFTNPGFRTFVWAFLREKLRGSVEPIPGPEIAYIFTGPEYRSRRLGRHLIDRVNAWLGSRGVDLYWVQTIAEVENRAIGFYERNGFQRAGLRRERGRDFVVFQKSLEAA